MIEFKCSQCGKPLRVKDEAAGKKGKCPQCGKTLLVPEQETVTLEAIDSPSAPPPPPQANSGTGKSRRVAPTGQIGRRHRRWVVVLLIAAIIAIPIVPKLPLWLGIVLLVLCVLTFVPRARSVSHRLLRLNTEQKWSSGIRLAMYGLIGLVLILGGIGGARFKAEQDRLAAQEAVEEVEQRQLTSEANETVPPTRRPLEGDVMIDVKVTELPDRRIRLHGTTNLPTKTNLMLSVEERMQGGFLGQSKCSVASDGSFSSEAFGPSGGLKDGLYIAEVMMPIPRVQPDEVKTIIGENGEHLSGPLVENDSFGVTVSAKREFTIGGAQAAQVQQQRAKDAEESIAKLKSDICVQLEHLLEFKDKQDFKAYGFGRGGPYHKWLSAVEALRDSQPKGLIHSVPLALRAAPGDLIMLGMAYMQKGRETDYTRQMLPELKQTIDYADYLATKSQRGRNGP